MRMMKKRRKRRSEFSRSMGYFIISVAWRRDSLSSLVHRQSGAPATFTPRPSPQSHVIWAYLSKRQTYRLRAHSDRDTFILNFRQSAGDSSSWLLSVPRI